MRLAIVGIRGLPNNYGGFETLAEHLVEHLSNEIDITVYCSSTDMPANLTEYYGAKLIYIPITSHGAFGILYDSVSLLNAVVKNDKILFLGFGGGFVMPLLRFYRSKLILNIGGLDWQRNKWSPFAQKVIKTAESLLVKGSAQIIADNKGIQNYLLAEYGRPSTLITYGGDQAKKIPVTTEYISQYSFLEKQYAFIVTRIQPDNNIDMILEAFLDQRFMPIVMVGNWKNSRYGTGLRAKYSNRNNLILLDAIYDRVKLDVLRSNCTIYIHGHSAGGTNPSLVEAMYLSLPVFAFASGYNEYTTNNEAMYFKNASELSMLMKNYQKLNIHMIGKKLKGIADKYYRWKIITNQYKAIILKAKT